MTLVRDAPFYRAEAALKSIPGVLGVGLSYKQTGGVITNRVAFVVVVRTKLHRRELPASRLIPPMFEGVPTDVWEPLRSPPTATSVLVGGIEMAAKGIESATIGCFAKLTAGSPQDTFILTTHHALYDAATATGPAGDVGAPDVTCSWCCTTGKVGEVFDGIGINNLDCGLAKLTGQRPAQQIIPGLGPTSDKQDSDLILGVAPLKTVDQGLLSPVALGEHVRKVGQTTGLTGGTIWGLNVFLDPDPDTHLPEMDNQIVVSPLQEESKKLSDGKFHFSSYGDSGSVVMNDANLIVGLLHRAPGFLAQSPPGFPPSQPWWGRGGAFTDINKVIAALKITIPKSSPDGGTQPARGLVAGGGMYRVPRLSAAEQLRRTVIENMKEELRGFALGRRLVEFIERHQPEIAHLINHDRRVLVAWHRAQGPRFVAQLSRDLRDLDSPIPRSVEGSSVEACLSSMRAALETRGSEELRTDLASLRVPLEKLVRSSATLRSLVENLRMVEEHV